MPRSLLYRSPPLACAALLALAAPAFAQSGTDTTPTTTATTGTLSPHAISVGSEDVKLDDVVEVGIAACEDDAEIKIEIDGVPTDKSLDIYTGTHCNDKSRDTKTDTTASNCDFITNAPAGPSKGLMVSLHAKELIGDCTKDADDTKTLWFVAVSASQAGEDGTTYGTIQKLHLDTRRPAAPTAVKGGSGESEIPIEWNATGADLDGFVVLIDANPTDGSSSSAAGSGSSMEDEDGGAVSGRGGNSSNGECGSSEITPGTVDSGVSSRIVRKKVGEPTATGVKLKPGDIGGGDGSSAAIAVVAIDQAGNESLVSEIACVKVVPTEGFWDRYQSDPNAVDPGCPCTAMGPAQLESAWPIALSLALCGLSARRRRRS